MTTTQTERSTLNETDSADLTQTLLYRLRRVQQRAAAMFVDTIGDTQITPTQWAVLTTLKRHGALSQNQLGRLTYMDPATTQGVILRLADRNMVERRPDPGDRRRTSVSLSKAGAAFVDQLTDNSKRANERVMEPLTAAERETLLRLLEKLM
ncbi:MAG TPA: MarR family transcriptional regulator [Azospirillaceae bacterium]|nr:MarR family transcriptional regulator [Azospirillaceae bacterium]HRQ80474.1 MarR family transcriptional regulator [Azospirillaceae bacterium]